MAVRNCKPGSTAGVLELGYICTYVHTYRYMYTHIYDSFPLENVHPWRQVMQCSLTHRKRDTFTTFQIQVKKVTLALYKQSIWTCVLVISVVVIKHHD